MAIVYVDHESIKNSVDYFVEANTISGEQLGMFFFFKAIGFDSKTFKAFPKVSGISPERRKEYLTTIYNLSGIYDYSNEEGKKKCCLFPFSLAAEIGKSNLFNPGTAFKGLLSRMRDTVDNTLIDDNKFLRKDESSPDDFRFPQNYIDILLQNFLQNEKVSIVHLAAWYFRFRGVTVPNEWISDKTEDVEKAFTRVCVKKMITDLNISENELESIFYWNETESISFSETKISGVELRGMMNFHNDYKPEVTVLSEGGNDYMNEITSIDLDETEELAQPTGDNISKEQLLTLLKSSKQVILYGAPGTSKSHIAEELKSDFEETLTIQFHASLTYEQFIGGISIDDDGNFVSKAGVFLSFCQRAKQNPDKEYLFIIDEINRGNVSKVFGETILALDREYKVSLANAINVGEEKITEFQIPRNLNIIATMNSADRSIAQIDFAIRRRFAFVKFFPNYELLKSISDCEAIPDISPDVLLKSINKSIFNVLKDENMLLGHAYFIPRWAINDGKIKWTYEVLKMLFNYYVIPIIEEYTYGNTRYLNNILGTSLPKRIEDTDKFIEALSEKFTIK